MGGGSYIHADVSIMLMNKPCYKSANTGNHPTVSTSLPLAVINVQ